MSTKRSRELVTFVRPFQLTGMDQIEPPVLVQVTATEEQQIGDLVFESAATGRRPYAGRRNQVS